MIFLIKASTIMALIRLITGSIEIICAVIIYQSGNPKTILRLSAVMGILGPIALLLGLALGLTNLQDVSPYKLGMILLGAILLIIGSFI